MIDYNDSAYNVIKPKSDITKLSISKEAYIGVKKNFDKLMVDGYNKSFSVVKGVDRGISDELFNDRITSNHTENLDVKNKQITQVIFNNNALLSFIRTSEGASNNINLMNSASSMRANSVIGYSANKSIENSLLEVSKKLDAPRVKQYIYANNGETEDGINLILSDGEYIISIQGKYFAIDSSNVLEYVKYFHNEYDVNIKKVYLQNKLIYEEVRDKSQSTISIDEDSSFNIYF